MEKKVENKKAKSVIAVIMMVFIALTMLFCTSAAFADDNADTDDIMYKDVISAKAQARYEQRLDRLTKYLHLNEGSRYAKASHIYGYVVRSCEYKDAVFGTLPNTTYSALMLHRGSSMASSLLIKDMCDKAGVPCRSVASVRSDGTVTGCNLIKIGKKWYVCRASEDQKSGRIRNFLKGDKNAGTENDGEFTGQNIRISRTDYR